MAVRLFSLRFVRHCKVSEMKYNPKHYSDKEFRDKAFAWWSTLSLNEMKALEKKHRIISYRANAAEIAAIYDLEVNLS